MQFFKKNILCGLLAATTFTPLCGETADTARGAKLYKMRCGACHAVETNGVGPAHKNVVGRKAGLAVGYDYSAAVKASTLIWNDANLERWLTNPEKLIPGQKMNYAVSTEIDRADIIAHLMTLK